MLGDLLQGAGEAADTLQHLTRGARIGRQGECHEHRKFTAHPDGYKRAPAIKRLVTRRAR